MSSFYSWLMSVYIRDILSRLPQLLASCTAVFGSVLKLDSTKKVCKKLQGTAAGSASCCMNVGNERGEVLISVLTESEGLEGLHPMVVGLIERYACVVFIEKFSCIWNSPDTGRPGRIHHNCCTLTGIVVASVASPGVHNFFMSGTTCR